MREKLLVDLLLNYKSPINISSIAEKLEYSESTIRKLIKEIKLTSKRDGFYIELQKGKGYSLNIINSELFQKYIQELSNEIDVLNVEQRLDAILFHILQADGYITIEELVNRIHVSRSTVLKDLELAKEALKKFDLDLEKKPHYGVAINGEELNFRKAFSKYVLQSSLYLEPTIQFKYFLKSCETENISEYFRNLLSTKQVVVTEMIFENLLIHLKIVLYRAMQKKYIKKDHIKIKKVQHVYMEVADNLSSWIEYEFGIKLPTEEIHFLAAHISAKASTKKMNSRTKEDMFNDLQDILKTLDEEFLTDFSNDSELVEGLLLHIYPLLDRLYYDLQLENPLFEEIKIKYTNVLVVAFRFGELIGIKYGYNLTRDEIGYIAFHLATHFEREKQRIIDKVNRIVVVCSTGGGSAHLIRLKLEKMFSNALVMTVSNKNIDAFKDDLPDLFLSTIPMEKEFEGVPIIQIKNFLDEIELKHIMDFTMQQVSARKMNSRVFGLKKLFSENYFEILKKGNYLEIIKDQAIRMVEKEAAEEGFDDLVMERESKFPTIYDKGIAGPHPIRLNAKENVIGVTILKKPLKWQQRDVRIIFLINLKKGHLFLHKEISRFLTILMEDEKLIDRLIQVKNYIEFISVIDDIIMEE